MQRRILKVRGLRPIDVPIGRKPVAEHAGFPRSGSAHQKNRARSRGVQSSDLVLLAGHLERKRRLGLPSDAEEAAQHVRVEGVEFEQRELVGIRRPQMVVVISAVSLLLLLSLQPLRFQRLRVSVLAAL